MTLDQADQPCTDPGPEVVDRGHFGRVQGPEASEVFESGMGFASFSIGFFEAPAFLRRMSEGESSCLHLQRDHCL